MCGSCGFKCAKYFLYVFNSIFWCVGGALVGVGIWLIVEEASLKLLHITADHTTEQLIRAASVILVVVGGLFILIGCLGCCGACYENSTVLFVFATLLSLLITVQVTAAILAGIYRQQIIDKLLESMNTTLSRDYGMDGVITESWDSLQINMKCCGVHNFTDWSDSLWHNNISGQENNQSVPISCCVLNEAKSPVNPESCFSSGYENFTTSNPNTETYVHKGGCFDSFYTWIELRLFIIIGVATGVMILQISGIIFACCVSQSISNKNVYS